MCQVKEGKPKTSDGNVIVYKVVQVPKDGIVTTTWGPGIWFEDMHRAAAIQVRKIRGFKPLEKRNGICCFMRMEDAETYRRRYQRRFSLGTSIIMPYQIPKGRRYVEGQISAGSMGSEIKSARAEQLVAFQG